MYSAANTSWKYRWAFFDSLRTQLQYLREHGGKARVEGHKCARVSCTWDSAVFLCNEKPEDLHISCGTLAILLEDLMKECTRRYPDAVDVSTLGPAQRWSILANLPFS